MYPSKILKHLVPLLSHILALIINNSFYSGKSPNSLKPARVIPIFMKADDKQNVSNYRSISILPILSNFFFYPNIISFFFKYNLFSNNQYSL